MVEGAGIAGPIALIGAKHVGQDGSTESPAGA